MNLGRLLEKYNKDKIAYERAASREKPSYFVRLKNSCKALLKEELRQKRQLKKLQQNHSLFR